MWTQSHAHARTGTVYACVHECMCVRECVWQREDQTRECTRTHALSPSFSRSLSLSLSFYPYVIFFLLCCPVSSFLSLSFFLHFCLSFYTHISHLCLIFLSLLSRSLSCALHTQEWSKAPIGDLVRHLGESIVTWQSRCVVVPVVVPVAVWCRIVLCCSVPFGLSVCWSFWQRVAACRSMLQRVAASLFAYRSCFNLHSESFISQNNALQTKYCWVCIVLHCVLEWCNAFRIFRFAGFDDPAKCEWGMSHRSH